MSVFVFDEEEELYSAKLGGVELVCEEVAPEFEKAAPELARAYHEKLPQIAGFMLGEITAVFGDMTADALTAALGAPQIDLDREVVSWLEHTLDDCHIIDVEYGGLFDELYGVNIDG